MCAPTKCRSCGKTTWTGCGMHVDQVMRGVPTSDRCTCDDAASAAAPKKSGSVFSRLRGRG